jgi:hypothetical protein
MSPIDDVESDSESDSEYDSSSESEYDDDECQGCIYKETGCFMRWNDNHNRIFEMTSFADYQDWCNDCMNAEGDCLIEKCKVNHALPSNKWFANGVCLPCT